MGAMPMSARSRSVVLAISAALAVAACGSSSGPSDGTGGSNAGTGGSNAGTGGTATGGAGTGGANTGGGGGTGGAGTGGVGGGTSAAAFLDDCFAGLRKLADTSQTSDRSSTDGAYRVRLAIEWPPGTVGTSGTIAWEAVRIGIVTPQKRVCIKDEKALASAYQGSLHNCMDTLKVMSEGLVFELKPPDVAPTRPVAKLTVTGAAAIPAVMLPTVTCKNTTGDGCASGGPCQ
jgi:hypothetical protein